MRAGGAMVRAEENEMSNDTDTGFSQWCILELMGHRRLAGLVTEATLAGGLMGHRRLAGLVTEATLAGGSFLRIDIYGEGIDEPIVTQFYSPSSVYAITPTTEAVCRRMGMKFRPQPVSEWDLLPAPERAGRHADDDPDDEYPI